MSFDLICPNCQHNLEVDNELIGEQAQCPNCAHEFIIQSPEIPILSCPNCNSTLHPQAVICSNCGYHLELGRNVKEISREKRQRRKYTFISIFVAAIILLMIAGYFFIDSFIKKRRLDDAKLLCSNRYEYKNSGKCGVIDGKSRFITPAIYDSLHYNKEYNFLIVKKDGNYGFMDMNGDYILEPKITSFTPCTPPEFIDGQTWACDSTCNKYGVIDVSGQWVIKPKYSDPGRVVEDGFYLRYRGATHDNPYLLFNKEGAKTEWFRSSSHYPEEKIFKICMELPPPGGYIHMEGISRDAQNRSKEIFIDENLKSILKPGMELITGSTYGFSEGLAPVEGITENNEKAIGYIDPKGNWVIKPQYGFSYGEIEFHNGAAGALDIKKNLWGIIDKKGNWVVKPKYRDHRKDENEYTLFKAKLKEFQKGTGK